MSTVFTDKHNREWDLALNAPVLRDIRETYKINLTALDSDPLNQLEANPELLVDVLYLICKDQADAISVTSRDFGKGLKPSLDEPIQALVNAIVNFFPAGKRSAVQSALIAQQKASNKALEQLTQRLTSQETVDKIVKRAVEEGEKALQDHLTQVTGASSTDTT